MKTKWIFWPICFLAMGAVMTWVLMLLWNWLIPDLFGLSMISFWQALGILVLSKMIFGGFFWRHGYHHQCCGHGRHYEWKQKFKSKWQNMSEEDRRKWEEKFGNRWGNCSTGEAEEAG